MKEDNKKEFSITISSWTLNGLRKIEAKTCIPLKFWVESELIKAIYRNRDFNKSKHKRRGIR